MPMFDRVRRGERLKIRADQWNTMADLAERAAREADGFGAANQLPDALAPNTVLIRNTTATPVPQFGVLNVGGVLFNPAESAALAAEFAARPILQGSNPATGEARLVVALEPIAPNAIGRAAACGVFACRVNVCDAAHRYATSKANDVTQLQSAAAGPVQLLWLEPGTGANKWAVGAM